MSVGFHIKDAGNNNTLKINGEGEIGVAVHTHPPVNEEVEAYPFSQWFTDDGLSTGDNDMRVDGSSVNVDFYICASSSVDIFIKSISVQISDQSAVLNKFGNLTALTNGLTFHYATNVLGDIVIQDQIKTNLDFVRLGLSTAGVGDGSSAFRSDVSGSSADTYLPIIDLSVTFGFPWGLRLKKGTNDCLGFTVKDNVSGVDVFNIKGFGVQL